MKVSYTEKQPRVHCTRAKVVSSRDLPDGFARMKLIIPAIARQAKPGQFVSVLCPTDDRRVRMFNTAEDWAAVYRRKPARAPGSPPLLRRPISIHQVGKNGTLELLFKVIGRGTKLLSCLKSRDHVDVLGPMGNGFDLSGRYDTAIIVAGGAGIAPMPYLAKTLHKMKKKVVIIAGTKDVFPIDMSLFSSFGAELLLSKETRHRGYHHGLCTELLEQYLDKCGRRTCHSVQAFSCGPKAMQHAVAKICSKNSVPLQVSLEQRMGCAMGACMACVQKVLNKQGYSDAHNVRVCTEGPVFDGEKVVWNEK